MADNEINEEKKLIEEYRRLYQRIDKLKSETKIGKVQTKLKEIRKKLVKSYGWDWKDVRKKNMVSLPKNPPQIQVTRRENRRVLYAQGMYEEDKIFIEKIKENC